MASHPVGHSAEALRSEALRYYSNRSHWPFEQAGCMQWASTQVTPQGHDLAHGDQVAFVAIPNPAALLAGW